MGIRSWLVNVKDIEDIENTLAFIENVTQATGVDNLPLLMGGAKIRRKNYLLLQTDGEHCMSFMKDFGIKSKPLQLERFRVLATPNGARILGAKYYKTLIDLTLDLDK